MKKDERLIQELLFINSRKRFNLRDLMERFAISKRTALRDIEALERIGVPLYSERGSHGGYHLLEHKLLPPIYFNDNELHAIFFSLQLLKSLLVTPFEQDYQQIKTKLLAVLSPPQQEKVLFADQMIRYTGMEQHQESPHLKALFDAIFQKQVIVITYTRYHTEIREIQPLQLQTIDGNWYCSCYDLSKQAFRIFRCDFIESVEQSSKAALVFTPEELEHRYQDQLRADRPYRFQVQLYPDGEEQFYKRHYANMELVRTSDGTYIEGTFGKQEIPFLVRYFLSFGKTISILEPSELKKAYTAYLRELLDRCE